jgi:DeoR family transcriptional regulator, aga operon transcriptional repressor
MQQSGRYARMYGSADDRRAQLMEMVEQEGYCTIVELSKAFDVSDMTIRRDVRTLVREGRLRSVHGGVTVLPQNAMLGTDFRSRASRMGAAKRAVAHRALDYVPKAGAIALDAGTTTLEMAAGLPADSRVQIVTPSLAAVNALIGHEGVEVMCLGGKLHPSTQSFAGPATVAAIGELRVRTFFLAASGLHADGVYCGNDFDAVTKRALVDVADEVVLLTDSSKFTISAMVRACSLAEVHRVITDDGITPEQLDSLTDHVRDVVVVPVPATTGGDADNETGSPGRAQEST